MAVPTQVEMDAPDIAAAARQQRLAAIATDLGVHAPPPASPLVKPLQPFSVRSPLDDEDAEKLLRQRRVDTVGQRPPTLMRAFTTNRRKEWEPAEIFSALEQHVGQNGSAALAEALVVKLMDVGGNLNVANTKVKVSRLTRRRSVESFERSRLLQRAIELDSSDTVAVLAPYADPLTLDTSLPTAIQSGRIDMVKSLLRYGASTANTTAGQQAFREICSSDANSSMVALLLAANGRPEPSELSYAMIDAAKNGCYENVMHLSRADADGNFTNAAALCAAIASSRLDIALAIVTGAHPPNSVTVTSAFKLLFEHPTVLPNDKMALAEILLCAGAHGDIVAYHLKQSCLNNFTAMAQLLADYGASVEYDNAAALRRALSQRQIDLVKILLSENVVVSPRRASKCITYIPKSISYEERFQLLILLLRKGAGGGPLNDYLIDVTAAGDVDSARLLLNPYYPEFASSPHDRRASHRRSTMQRHHTASVDHKDGTALQLAVQTANYDIVEAMLAPRPTRPSPDTLAKVFPNIFNLPPDQRYEMLDIFLRTGFSGPVITDALQKAIQEPPQDRDRLIAALLQANADVNASLVSAVANGDVGLVQNFLRKGQPTKQALAAALSQTETLTDQNTRQHIIHSLLGAGAHEDRPAVANLLTHTLSQPELDMKVVEMLLIQGDADINHAAGKAVVLAAASPDENILQRLLTTKKATRETIVHGLNSLANHPSTAAKAIKLKTLLCYTNDDMSESLDHLLVSEVIMVVKAPVKERIPTVIQVLLSAGADVNAHNADALGHAVAGSVVQIVEMLLAYKPNNTSLIRTIPRIFSISDPMDRLAVAKMLLEAGVPASEVNVTLNHAVVHFPQDHPLIKVLATAADRDNGGAVLSAVRSNTPDLLAALLEAKEFDVSVLNVALSEAMNISDKPTRLAMCKQILEAGATGSVVSDALLVASASGDLDLGNLLIANGATADHNDGQAFIAACRSGAAGVVQMLMKNRVALTSDTLSRGFQEAGKIDDLKSRESVFRLLLKAGVSGEALDKELATSAGYGDDGVGLVRLLLSHKADANYNDGESVRISTRNGFMATLKLLLRITNEDDNEASTAKTDRPGHPSQDTMARALKISWMLKSELRYQIIQWLFAAGLEPKESVHIALNKAVKETSPNLELVRLLLEHGASPVADGCQALVNAACRSDTATLELCTSLSEVSTANLGYVLAEALDPSRVKAWLTQKGLDTAQLLFDKGAKSNELGPVLKLCVEDCAGDSDSSSIARQFVQLLVMNGANVDIEQGAPLQTAARLGDADLVQQLLTLGPSAESKAMAFSYIFDSGVSEDVVVRLIELFREDRINGADKGLDVLFSHPECEPVLFLAMSQYPRSVRILEALLDAGYYHDQMVTVLVTPDVGGEEAVSLLFWALLQPQKKISSSLIDLLIERGSNVNFETRLSMATPLMLAIQSSRSDIVQSLIRAGANVDVADHAGNTPLIMAVRAGSERGTEMMADILKCEPSKNDGSLHLAAKLLNLPAMKLLVKAKHDMDFPCPEYGGRSALAELCLHSSDGGAMIGSRLKILEQCMAFLVDHGSDVQLKSNGKTPLLLALESYDPVATTKSLLKAGLYKYVNSPFNQFRYGELIYSPTMYVRLVLQPPTTVREQLVAILQSNRAEDLFYARSGPQPQGAVNVPEELMGAERERQARREREEAEERERAQARRHAEELAELNERARREEIRLMNERAAAEERAMRQKAIAAAEAQVEASRIRAAGDMVVVRQRAAADAEATHMRARAETEAQRRRAAVEADAAHARALQREAEQQAELDFARRQGQHTFELEDRTQRMLLSYEQQRSQEQVNAAQQVSAIQVDQRRMVDVYDHAQNQREMKRLAEGRRLASAIKQLPAGATHPGNRNPAGYIMGEVP